MIFSIGIFHNSPEQHSCAPITGISNGLGGETILLQLIESERELQDFNLEVCQKNIVVVGLGVGGLADILCQARPPAYSCKNTERKKESK